MRKSVVVVVSFLLTLVLVTGTALAATGSLTREGAIRAAQSQVARPTQVAATSEAKSSGQWTVSLKQQGAPSAERIYVIIGRGGRALEWGRLKDGKLSPVQVTPEQALRLAQRSAGNRYYPVEAKVFLTAGTLAWEVILYNDSGFYQVTLDAFSGKVLRRGPAAADSAPGLISKEKAVAIARSRVSYPSRLVSAKLTQYKNTLAWEVRLTRAGIGVPYADTFYIAARDGRVLAREGAEQKPATISRERAVALAQRRVGVATKLVDARLDNWSGQQHWVVTLVEDKKSGNWHIVVLDAENASIRQYLRISF
ncbi:MAG: PepSY domain-containing protein [Firmicutes bacterium]|nr:PepSY domain-containing protein [Bacillota bacterium]